MATTMPAMTGSPGQTTTFQGPTNLASTTGGAWDTYAATVPGTVSAIHSVQLYNGKVLLMAGSGNIPGNLAAGKFTTYLWTPTTGTFQSIPTPYDMFCSGHTELADGNILILGGTTAYPQYNSSHQMTQSFQGSKQAYIFNVATSSYQQTGSMATARWYPTAVTLGNGNVLAVGGLDTLGPSLHDVSHDTDTVEQYNPATGAFSKLPSMDFTKTVPSQKTTAVVGNPWATHTFPQYAGMTLLANGNLFYSGSSFSNNGVTAGVWNPLTGSYTDVPGLPAPTLRGSSSSILLPPAQAQKVMVMGGLGGNTATNSTAVVNLSGVGTSANPTPTYVAGPNMEAAKMFVGAVILPDYTVMETNGASQYKTGGVHTAEDYNPVTDTFTIWNAPLLDRMYHSEAFLLPDGRVAILGSQPLSLAFEMHISIYSPPYLFKGQRPTLAGTSALTRSGMAQGAYTITTAAGSSLSHVSLIRPSATTHSDDPDQRLVDLPYTKTSTGTYQVTVPSNLNLTPAGWYMMFATDNLGRPSVAQWVKVN